jgi:hypothetical protein
MDKERIKMTGFQDIKAIFNKAMSASKDNIGEVNLQNKHSSPTYPNLYGDFTNVHLQAAVAKGIPFFQAGIIPPRNTIGTRGEEANMVKALRGQLKFPDGQPVRLMPGSGPMMPDADIATIVDWINHGCPD